MYCKNKREGEAGGGGGYQEQSVDIYQCML